jgi:hypothetical protein
MIPAIVYGVCGLLLIAGLTLVVRLIGTPGRHADDDWFWQSERPHYARPSKRAVNRFMRQPDSVDKLAAAWYVPASLLDGLLATQEAIARADAVLRSVTP